METNQTNKPQQRRRPPQQQARRSSGKPKQRPDTLTDSRRPPAKKAAVRRKSTQPTDRERREKAARAAKLKAMKQEAARKNAQPAPQAQRRVRKPRRPMQPVVYTQPKVFNRTRLMVQLISIMAVVLALILCLSIFFRVETITVSGANAYSAWAVREASGISEGDYLMTFSRAKAAAKIKAELPYVDKVRIGIKLPNTVNIVITEINVVYSIQCQDGIWWLITSEGTVMEQTNAGEAANYTKVLGVTLASPTLGEQARAYETAPVSASTSETGETEATTPVTVTNQQRLNAALEILQALELNEIVGEAASVDVSELERIELWYGTRYQVNLGDTSNMDYKIASMKSSIDNVLSDYDMGELDCSFTQWEKVGYTPFE